MEETVHVSNALPKRLEVNRIYRQISDPTPDNKAFAPPSGNSTTAPGREITSHVDADRPARPSIAAHDHPDDRKMCLVVCLRRPPGSFGGLRRTRCPASNDGLKHDALRPEHSRVTHDQRTSGGGVRSKGIP